MQCSEGYVSAHVPDESVEGGNTFFWLNVATLATNDDIKSFIDKTVSGIRDVGIQQQIRERLNVALLEPLSEDTAKKTEKAWKDCEEKSAKINSENFNERRAKLLVGLICEGKENGSSIAKGVARNWLSRRATTSSFLLPDFLSTLLGTSARIDREFAASFSKTLLAEVNSGCSIARTLDGRIKQEIRDAANAKASPPPLLPLIQSQ